MQTFAADITINGTVNHDVWGNGTDTEGTPGTAPTSTTGNSVTINGGTVNSVVIGGEASGIGSTSTATGNIVTINGGTVNDAVAGGFTNSAGGTSKVTGNTVTINGGTINGSISGGSSSGGVGDLFTDNKLYLNSAVNIVTVRNFEYIYFGSIGTANITTLNTAPTGVTGGSPLVKMNTQGNDITFGGVISGSGGIEKTGAGTLTLSGINTYNGGTTVSAGTLAGNTSSLQGNILNNANVEFVQTTDGTYAGTMSGIGTLTKTGAGTLTLSGNNNYTGLTEVKGGTLALSGSGNISNRLALYDGATFNTGGAAVNYLDRLDVRGEAKWTGNLDMTGKVINFYVPVGAPTGATMLNVGGTADITDSTVNVYLDGGSTVPQAGEQITLIDATGGLTGEPTRITSDKWSQGVSLQYDFDIQKSVSGNQLLATVRATLNPQTKAFSEARLSQLAFTNQGSDLVAGQGLSAALDATANRTERRTTTFGTLSGGSSRYKTGSHSDVTGVSLITGLTGNSRLALGKLTLGAFFEYGNANYDSYNSFTNAASVRGNGKTDYTGGGVLAHLEFNPTARGNAWLESSARFGRATVDFQTNDMGLGQHAAFDSNSNYAAAHIGAGYHWNLTKRNGFDLYAQYLWSRQNADTVTLTTGDTVKFETANSERLRLGSRFVYNLNPHRRAYAGIAWEHEFDGEANASISGYRVDTPKLTGDTCKLELGLTLQPTKTCPITRNFGIQGYTGKREGIAGSVEVRYEF